MISFQPENEFFELMGEAGKLIPVMGALHALIGA